MGGTCCTSNGKNEEGRDTVLDMAERHFDRVESSLLIEQKSKIEI